MAEKWSTLHGWSQKECVDKYLENARRWPFFGSKLFEAQVWLIIHSDPYHSFGKISYKILAFYITCLSRLYIGVHGIENYFEASVVCGR